MTISGFFKRPSRAQSASFIAASILIAAIFGANELTLARLRGEILDSTTMNLKSQVIVLASEIDRSLKLLDLSLSSISDQIASFGINDAATLQHKTEGQDFHQLLKNKMVALTHVDAITLISDQGKLISFSRSWPAPEIDVTDRDYYKALKNDASLKSFVGEPVRNRGTGTWTIYLARRLSSPDGHFIGILLGAVAIESYEEYFQSIALQDGSAIALLRDDGLLLARYPQSNLIGKILPMYAQARKTPLPFTLNLKSPADNQPRLVAAQRLTSFPMGVLVSETEQGALRSWRSFAVISYSTAVAGSLLLLLVLLLMMRWWRKQELLAEEASLRNDRFDAAISNMSQGLCLFDADKKLVIANSRFREIYGLPEDAVRPGTPLSQILQHHVDRGQKSDLSVEQHVQTIPEELNQVFTLADGRVILIKRTPMSSGGWVATHEDITEREQSEMAALKSKALLRSTLTSLSEGVVVQDASGRIISCNPAAERILGVKPNELWGRTSADTRWQAIREDGREFPSHEHPSAMALATGERQNQIVMGLRHDDGSITWISVNSVPLYVAGSTELDTVVTSFSDITARKLAQEVLTEAIAAIPDGFVIFDNNDRLVASNEAYKEIYAASAPAIKPGVTFSELLRYGIDHGQYPEAGETEQQQSKWLAERIGQHRASKADIVQQLSDGRWLQIRERMTPSGYIVGFRTDVTALKRETAKLQAVIDNFPGGISFLDANLNIVACNPAFRGLLDLPDDLFQDGLPSLEMVLRASALRGEFGPGDPDEHVRERIALARKEGPQLFERTRPNGTVLEIRGTPIKGGGSIRTFMDITARHTAEKQLFDSERRAKEKSATLELTLAHMSQGLSMYDAGGHLIVWNDRYAEIYGLSPDLLKQGVNVDAISEYMSQTGYVGTDEPDWRQRLADNDSFAATLRFSDGRVIRIVRTPIEGSGWVATHEDITEQMRAEASLFEQSTELARINMHFDAALSNMTQGLCMFDGERRLLVWNDRYAELYQIPAHLLKVGTPHDAIIADRISRGILKGETGESAAMAKIDALGRLPKNETASRVDEFADGRFMLITRQPMADGGWLATHEDITERRRTEAEIVHLARHDVLTGLANRAEFNAKLEEASKRLKRNGGAVTVMMLDLDKFKAVNDTLGHPAGDKLLVEVARRLKSSVRETDVVARLGGDEFAIIQEGGPDQREGAITLALRIISAITQPFDLDGQHASVGTSIGIALAPEHGMDPEALLKRADLALYNVKAGGKNDFRLFQAEMLEAVYTQQSAESELRAAIARDEFELYYQPVVNAKTRLLCGVEALVRWRHPTKGLIGPDDFIPLAELTGLIVQIGEWTLQQACKDAASWPEHVKVAINISAVQFKKGNLLDVVLCTLVETGLSPARLELEITETALLENQEAYLTIIRQLKNLGISMALDDFGTGHSSVNYLTNFPFDKIKIDKSFTRGVLDRRDCKAVVASTLALAHGLGTLTTAEGIETEEQFEYLRNAGVDLVQGYLFGRPTPISQLDDIMTLSEEMVA